MSPEELFTLRTLEIEYDKTRYGQRPFDWQGYFSKWKDLVLDIERGYSYTIYDYTNDVSVRGVLEGFLRLVPSGLADKLLLELKPIDDKFMSLTSVTDKHLPGLDVSAWWHRIPTTLVGELKDDVDRL